MIDGSTLSYEENAVQTSKVVKIAHTVGIVHSHQPKNVILFQKLMVNFIFPNGYTLGDKA